VRSQKVKLLVKQKVKLLWLNRFSCLARQFIANFLESNLRGWSKQQAW
jgi:hypothetical protein